MNVKRLALGILDGWGVGPVWGGNAIANADTPNYTYLWAKFPRITLQASGDAVGLSGHEMGNSEVGHFTLGAGRIVAQDAQRISSAITDKSFFHNTVILETINYCKEKHQSLHLLGLLTASNIHAKLEHLFALLDLLKLNNFREQVFIHLITDGRDSPPQSAMELLEKLNQKINQAGIGKIATISGRYFAMDRDDHKNRIEKTFACISKGEGLRVNTAWQAVSESYKRGLTDEYVEPSNIIEDNLPVGLIKKSHAVIFFNFRQDRARQLITILSQQVAKIKLLSFIPYQSKDMPQNVQICFTMPIIRNHLTEYISQQGLSQMHIAESEKFAHVTYFFNGGVEDEYPRERRIKIRSLAASAFENYPQMRANEIAQKTIEAMEHKYEFILFNFANADMIAHLAKPDIVNKAIEAIDKNLKNILQATIDNQYSLIITADHGNAEELINPKTGEISTSHSNNPVPLIMISNTVKILSNDLKTGMGLSSVAPTILQIMGLQIPAEMNAPSLIKEPSSSLSQPIASPSSYYYPLTQTPRNKKNQKSLLQNPSPIQNIR